MRSTGYTVDIFSSAADFLVSSRLAEAACMIADVQMPVTTGLELYRRLIDRGHAIPTILGPRFPMTLIRLAR
jgi:FixJ family two-component response regulator